jgi:LysR family nitrogen assimilation transcriptional regulator
MVDQIEALQALVAEGTMHRAAVRLRITASAVSKRIAALEATLGRPLIERTGRRVRLTAEGRRVVEATGPLVARLREALRSERQWSGGELVVGVAESILASWGAGLLARAAAGVPGLRLAIHTHRGNGVQERVAAGAYALGLVAGSPPRESDVVAERLGEEPMVLVPVGLDPATVPTRGHLAVYGPEPTSGTARALEAQLARLRKSSGLDIRITRPLESAAAIVQCAREGLGHGLAPLGIVRALGVPDEVLARLPGVPLVRPVVLLARKGAARAPLASALRAQLRVVAPTVLEWRRTKEAQP